MKIEINTVKGFQDFLPPESLKREAVKEIIKKYFKLYGFVPVETPVIEFDELAKTNQEDEAISERFKLQDRGQRNLALRYEFTFQLARIFKQNPNLKLPFRRYQIGEVFRDEPVSTSRFRQFTQCDADIIGSSDVKADAECIALASDILKELKINAEVQVNNRKLLTAIIKSVEMKEVEGIMRELDKIEKTGVDEVKSKLKKYASTNQIVTLFKLLSQDLNFFKKNAFAGADELEEFIEYCKDYGVKVILNSFLARGLGYYTGNVFEIKEQGKDTLIAGGRYGQTVGKYLQRDIPAVGISFGLGRITQLADIKISESQLRVLIISISQEKEAIKLSKVLRKEGVSCFVEFEKPGKALDFANFYSIPYVIFVGAEEMGKKKYKLKNMKTGNEKLLSEKQLVNAIKL